MDAEDFEFVRQWKWSVAETNPGRFYAVRVEGKKTYRMSRVIMGLCHGNRLMVDHIDPLATLDNRKQNLRIATSQENASNRTGYARSGFKGVRICGKSFQAQITVNRVCRSLGLYPTAEQAHAAYCKAASENFGEYARS